MTETLLKAIHANLCEVRDALQVLADRVQAHTGQLEPLTDVLRDRRDRRDRTLDNTGQELNIHLAQLAKALTERNQP